MIKLEDIYKAINVLLYSQYPKTKYKIYGNEVTEGYKTPSFFVNLRPKKMLNASVNYKERAYTIMITYFQEKANEIDNLTKVDEIEELFGYHLKVGERRIPIKEFDYEFIGNDKNILQISIETEYLEGTKKAETQPLAAEIILK